MNDARRHRGLAAGACPSGRGRRRHRSSPNLGRWHGGHVRRSDRARARRPMPADRCPRAVAQVGGSRRSGSRDHGFACAGPPEAAVRIFASAENQGVTPSWATCDRVAAALLHLGRPAEARRRLGARGRASFASDTLNPARHRRPGGARLAGRGANVPRAALELDGGLGEAWCGLALLYMQRGDASMRRSRARHYGCPQLLHRERSWRTWWRSPRRLLPTHPRVSEGYCQDSAEMRPEFAKGTVAPPRRTT